MRSFALLFLSGFCFAAPTISPSTATVFVSGSVTITSTDTVTCSLTAGSTGTLSGCVYTAPKSFTAHNVLNGCMARPNDDVYNTRIDNLPVDTNSVARFNHLLGGTTAHIAFEVSFPGNISTNATPNTATTFFYTTNNNGNFPIVPAPYTGVENTLYPANYFAQDRHVIGNNTDTCQFYDIYNPYPAGTNVPQSCPLCTAQAGISYVGSSYQLPNTGDGSGTSDAAGMFIGPPALKYKEIKSGVIKHALRFTLDNGDAYSGFIWPATNFTSECDTFTICFPYGSRWRLKSSFPISGFSQTSQVILTALKQYGMFFADGGTAMHIQAMNDVNTDTTTFNTLLNNSAPNEIASTNTITQFQFEQVDESSLIVSTSSGKVNLSNGFVTPDNFAQVIVTKNSDSSSTTLRIALEPVTVGFSNKPFPADTGSISIMAGTPQIPISFWVNGATTTTASCTMSPTVGTLTSGCLYTAPTTQVGLVTSTVTITPTADPSQALTVPLIIYPSNGIRVNTGGQSTFITDPVIPYTASGDYGPDLTGNIWWSDPVGSLPPWYSLDENGFPQASWPAGYPDVGLYYTDRHGASDGAFGAYVPNGTYVFHVGFGLNTSLSSVVQSLDSQNVVLASTTAMRGITGTTAYTPGTASFLVQVSNNQFYFAIRQVIQGDFTLLNNWSLIPFGAPTILGNAVLRGSAKLLAR